MNKNVLYGSFIVLECLLWGVGNTLIKIGYDIISPFCCLTLRFLLSFLVFVLLFFPRLVQHRKTILKCVPLSVMTAAGFLLSNLSLRYATATTAGLLMGLAVIFTPLLSRMVFGSRLEKRTMGCVVLVVIGMVLLCGIDGAGFGIGEGMALLSAFATAVSLTFSVSFLRTIDPIVLSTVQIGVTGFIALPFALLLEDVSQLRTVPMKGWLIIAYLVLGCTVAAYLMQNKALKHLSPVVASLILCMEPVLTVVAAYVILGERLSLIGYLGAVLIIGAVAGGSMPNKVPVLPKE